jgi:glucan phosphoethanolaminetransferase (alkaline phosphatase superfamily)
MNAVLWVVGIAASIGAIVCFWEYKQQPSENEGFSWMIYSIICVLIACACAFVWFFRKSRDEADQDISITKF